MDNSTRHNIFFNDLNFIIRNANHFHLYLSLCNDDSYIQQCHNKILNEYNEAVKWLSIPADNRFLLSFVENNIDSSKVTILSGLKDNKNINQLLAVMNMARSSFYKLNLPIILWVNSDLIFKFIRITPDFYNCTSSIHLEKLS